MYSYNVPIGLLQSTRLVISSTYFSGRRLAEAPCSEAASSAVKHAGCSIIDSLTSAAPSQTKLLYLSVNQRYSIGS